jgi:hypothetical protein
VSGITEILLVIAIVLAIVFLPRLAGKRGDLQEQKVSPGRKISVKMRVAVFASVLWPSAVALLLKPWDGSVIPFLYIGLAPLAVSWGIGWIIAGYRRGEK